jgi:drug/metabolite transporter (DMT)-like permease
MRKSLLIAGIVCIALGAWLILSHTLDDNIVPGIAVVVVGIALAAISRKR